MPAAKRTDRNTSATAPEDAPASGSLPRTAGLMLCQLVDKPFDHSAWIFEPKLDGLRALCRCDGPDVELLSRNDNSQTDRFPEIVAALKKAVTGPAMLDGEIVCLDETGRSSFHQIQQRFGLVNPTVIAQRASRFPAVIFIFDILYFKGRDLTGLPLSERKKILQATVRWDDSVRCTPVWPEHGIDRHANACRHSEEGIVGKRLDSPYVAARSGAWVKIKCVNRQEFVIGGYTDPQRSRVGLGATLIGYYDSAGKLVYAGKVGTGYSDVLLTSLREKLEKLTTAASPFAAGAAPPSDGVHWVKPKLVCEVGFAEWTHDGLVRQGRFEGLREDKSPAAVRREKPAHVSPAGPEIAVNPSPTNGGGREEIMAKIGKKSNSRERTKTAAAPTAAPTAALETYRKKRRFNATPEPSGKAKRPPTTAAKPGRPKAAGGHSFVIQEHHASHLHYDLRLEVDGVLKSWAVPKEPVMDVSVKRLAVQVEDHPLEYATFHGDIPKGEYGGGHVEIWDSGTYDNIMEGKSAPLTMKEALEAGHLEFELHGKRLRGTFAMVRMKGAQQKANWLLIKMKDSDAAPAAGGPVSDEPPSVSENGGKRGVEARKKAASKKTPAAGAGADLPEKPRKNAAGNRKATPRGAAAPPRGKTNRTAPAAGEDGRIVPEFTNVGKVMFPEVNVTKGDVLRYYISAAALLLPYLKDRPITVERFPDGVAPNAPRFWQKNTPAYYPDYIPRVTLEDEHGKNKKIDYALINSAEALLYFVNLGALTFHTWFSRIGSLDKPDYVLFDFDIGPADFSGCITAVKNLRKLLLDQGLTPVVKTSGKSGLHVLATPPQDSYEAARAWAMSIALELIKLQPDVLTVERSKEKRQGRIYVDVMQNGKGKHVVPPYVLRPTALATVSMPLDWKDVNEQLDPKKYTLQKSLETFAARKSDPMAPLLEAMR